jgi:hypothetical protein
LELFSGAGLILDHALTGGIGTAIGMGLGLADTFLIDKLLRGWKPNSFVDIQIKHFAGK